MAYLDMAAAAAAKAFYSGNGKLTRSAVLNALESTGGQFIQIGGISGFTAVALGAYAAHSHVFPEESNVKGSDEFYRKEVFNIGNRYHFFHSLALLVTPLFRIPLLTGTLLTLGIITFSGSCYIHALTGHKFARRATPYGGLMLLAAWLSMLI